jgi:hypothetical protein
MCSPRFIPNNTRIPARKNRAYDELLENIGLKENQKRFPKMSA